MCRLGNIALREYQDSVYRTDRLRDRQTPDKVIPMCRYALQATQKSEWENSRLGVSVSDLLRAKIRLGKFKAIYSINSWFNATVIDSTAVLNLTNTETILESFTVRTVKGGK